eukprot:m.155942 g.155942  ORF g.155942 m.155942 type:complete len:102 (+) comp13332_c0_seq2:128-433(+)
MWLMYFQRSDGGAVMKETTSLVFPIDATSKTLTHTFGGLDDNTRYNAWVTASSCAGDVDSSTDSAKTSLNIIIDGVVPACMYCSSHCLPSMIDKVALKVQF